MSDALALFATTAKGMEDLLLNEVHALGGRSAEVARAGVSFAGTLEVAYRVCLWSRVGNRVLLPLATFPAPTPQALYDGVRTIRWSEHLDARRTLAVDCAVSHSQITHSHFAALKTKDAIVDQLREHTGARPSIDVAHPDVRVNVYVHADRAVVSVDLSGESLHRRSYRQGGGAAPLKENLAAAVLFLADWPQLAAAGAPFVDPMCGSGTLPIEAALIAARVAPGRRRTYFGFLGWCGHEPEVWTRLCREAEEQEIRNPKRLPPIHGYDASAAAVRSALRNVEHAGLRGRVHIERRALADSAPIPAHGPRHLPGIVVANPPYGERLGDRAALGALYAELGDTLRRTFPGWTGYVLTGNAALSKRIGLRSTRRHVLYNGAIECRLLVFPISSKPVSGAGAPRWRRVAAGEAAQEPRLHERAEADCEQARGPQRLKGNFPRRA
ncbi:MAG TPA: THUMP domain-containing protein [Candidatus Margulisiibacteriota bacterium]|nr:THUMP domain-containing protein [Candidatus Margulisiibacteriota bacterium]